MCMEGGEWRQAPHVTTFSPQSIFLGDAEGFICFGCERLTPTIESAIYFFLNSFGAKYHCKEAFSFRNIISVKLKLSTRTC